MLFTPAVDSQPADGLGLVLFREIPLTEALDESSYFTELQTKPDQGPVRRRSRPHQIFPLVCKEGSDVPSLPPTREHNRLFFSERKPEPQWLTYIFKPFMVFGQVNANAVKTTKVILIGHPCQPLCASLAKASGPETNLSINIKCFAAHQINRHRVYILPSAATVWPAQDSQAKGTLSPPATLHCMGLIANIKRNDFLFDLTTAINHMQIHGWGDWTTEGKLQGWPWDQLEAFTLWSPDRMHPSSQKEDVSCHAFTPREKSLPSLHMALSREHFLLTTAAAAPEPLPPAAGQTNNLPTWELDSAHRGAQQAPLGQHSPGLQYEAPIQGIR